MDIFDTRTMLQAVEQIPRPRRFLLDTFFKGSQNFDTAYVDIDIVKGRRRMAPFVHPTMPGKVVDRTGYVMQSYKPPYVKPKMPTSAADLLKRQAGYTVYGNGDSMAQRAARQLGMDLAELDAMISRREEWMAASALNSGRIRCIGEGVDDTIDFRMAGDHQVTLDAPVLWNAIAPAEPGAPILSDPITDLSDWAILIGKDSGLAPNVCIMGLDAWRAYNNHPKTQKRMDMLKVSNGKIDPQQLPEGVTFCGTLNEAGISVDIYTYFEWYVDDITGEQMPMVPADKVWLGSTAAANKKLYGAIQDMAAAPGNFAVSRFPKSWLENDPGVRWIMVQSAPVIGLLQPDAFVSATVVGPLNVQ